MLRIFSLSLSLLYITTRALRLGSVGLSFFSRATVSGIPPHSVVQRYASGQGVIHHTDGSVLRAHLFHNHHHGDKIPHRSALRTHRRTLVLLTDTLVSVVGCVLLLWDHLLTLKDEIKYFWRLPVEFTTFIFLSNRYVVAGILCWSVYSEFVALSECG